jgi:FKBP-type peptidyl-prolyl cis-trans isomerase SlyD
MRVQIVSFHCVLKNKLGHLISSSFNQDVSTTSLAPQSPMLSGFVEILKKLKIGDKREISLAADQAYGFYDPDLVFQISRSKIYRGKQLKVGDTIHGVFNGDQSPREYRVASCSQKNVFLDGNHPLAGQDLVFNVEITSCHEEYEPDLAPRALMQLH